MEKNFDNGLFSFKATFMDFPAGGSPTFNSADLPRPSLGFPSINSLDMLDSSFAILDLSALDFGRDSIAIYDIKSARNKAENQSKDFQKEMFEICDPSLHQLPILFPKEDKCMDTTKTKQEASLQNNLDGSFNLTSKSSSDIFNKVFISYSTKSSIEELENVKNSIQFQESFNNVGNIGDSLFAHVETTNLSQNSPGNKSFDKERYLLDFVPQPDFDEFNLSNEHQKTYFVDKDSSPKPFNNKPEIKYVTQICKACQCDIFQESSDNLNEQAVYSEDDIKKSLKVLSEALNQKVSKFVLEKSQKMLKELENILNGNNMSPSGKKSINHNLDKEQKSATKRSSTVATLSDNKISENKEIVKQVKPTVTKNKPLRATLPVEKMSKIKGFNQPQSTEHVTPDKNVDSFTKLNKTITPSHENKRSSTPTSTPISRLPKTTKPLFYSPPARKQVLKPCNGSERRSWASPSIKSDQRPLLLKNHSFEGRTSFDRTKTAIAPKLKTGFSPKTFSGLTKTRQNLLDLPSYRNGNESVKSLSSGNTTTIQSRRASKENLKPFY